MDNIERQLNNISITTEGKLNFSSSGFVFVFSAAGIFLISVDGINPHGTGSRLSLQIGNTTSATVTNFTIRVTTEGKDADEETTTRKNYSSDKLEPGRWNNVSIDIPELAPNQLKDSFTVSLDVSGMSLLNPK